jgi:hypothetical protein
MDIKTAQVQQTFTKNGRKDKNQMVQMKNKLEDFNQTRHKLHS